MKKKLHLPDDPNKLPPGAGAGVVDDPNKEVPGAGAGDAPPKLKAEGAGAGVGVVLLPNGAGAGVVAPPKLNPPVAAGAGAGVGLPKLNPPGAGAVADGAGVAPKLNPLVMLLLLLFVCDDGCDGCCPSKFKLDEEEVDVDNPPVIAPRLAAGM